MAEPHNADTAEHVVSDTRLGMLTALCAERARLQQAIAALNQRVAALREQVEAECERALMSFERLPSQGVACGTPIAPLGGITLVVDWHDARASLLLLRARLRALLDPAPAGEPEMRLPSQTDKQNG